MIHVPNEIVDRILEDLYQDCKYNHKSTCTYASVCPLWQEFFEKKHFKTLFMDWQDLPDFKDYVVGARRRLVNHIRVRIYFGRLRYRGAPRTGVYSYVITTLFEILGTWWDIFNSKNPGNMVLQIEAKTFFSGPDLADLPQDYKLIYEPPLSPSRMPPVWVVKSLVLHQNAFNVFRAKPKALHYLLRSLPALGQLTSEGEMLYTPGHRDSEPWKVYELMIRSLPPSVSELSLSEVIGDPLDAFATLPPGGMNRTPAIDMSRLGLELARVSRQLRHLTASFVVDAKDFFRMFLTARPINTMEWAWDELETLALTSELLRRPHENEGQVNHLLQAVSVAVRRMPKLRTLEIWNGDDDQHVCIFHYGYSPGRVSLCLHGTREINIAQDTKRSWVETVRLKANVESEIRFEELFIVPPFVAENVSWLLELRDRVATEMVRKNPPHLVLCYPHSGTLGY